MIRASVDGIVLDIEGTTSSIDFVYQRMFPFVRRELDRFLAANCLEPEVVAACQEIAREGGLGPIEFLLDHEAARASGLEMIRGEVLRLMDSDAKSTGLKQLQGLIWRQGFESKELVAHVFDDVPDSLRRWSEIGVRVFIYSSGSVEAQKLFWGHTAAGHLLEYFSGFFDTTTGPKREPKSYAAIAAATSIPPARLLFVSDVAAEIQAASAAGFQVGLCVRPGNAPQPDGARWPQIERFDQLDIRR